MEPPLTLPFVSAMFRGKLHRRVVDALRRQEKMELLHASALSVQRVFRASLGRSMHKAERKRQYWEIRVRRVCAPGPCYAVVVPFKTATPYVHVQWVAVLNMQRVVRGLFGRLTYRRKILKRSEDIFMQVLLTPHVQCLGSLCADPSLSLTTFCLHTHRLCPPVHDRSSRCVRAP